MHMRISVCVALRVMRLWGYSFEVLTVLGFYGRLRLQVGMVYKVVVWYLYEYNFTNLLYFYYT